MKQKKSGGLRAGERRPLQLPTDFLENGPFIELRGQREICVQGCRKILLCNDDEVHLLLRGSLLMVRGQNLRCATYFAGAVAVTGWICGVEFAQENDRGGIEI